MLYFKESPESQKTCEVLKKDKKKFAKSSQLKGNHILKLCFVVKVKLLNVFTHQLTGNHILKLCFVVKVKLLNVLTEKNGEH